MMKKSLLLLSTIPLAFLAGCGGDKEPIKPDKEPAEMAKEQNLAPEEKKKLTVSDVSNFFTDERYLDDYKKEFEKAGYEKPFKDIVLSVGVPEKRGLIYKVEDGYSVVEYNKEDEQVVAVTSYETLEQLEVQEMKTKAYEKEAKLSGEKNPSEREKLMDEINSLWEEIGKLENGSLNVDEKDLTIVN